jgi:hypothetical protein
MTVPLHLGCGESLNSVLLKGLAKRSNNIFKGAAKRVNKDMNKKGKQITK